MRADTESPATLGAIFQLSGVEFCVWAPRCKSVAVKDVATSEIFNLMPTERGYFENMLYGMMPGRKYMLVLDGSIERPDPASRLQPDGVRGPSEVFDTTAIIWKDDAWRGIELKHYIIYQLHIGTFTPGGSLLTAVEKLPRIKELGFTAVELMPVAQFPGSRGWGFDCVFPYAVHHAYGGPLGLKTFVEEAHSLGLAVVCSMSLPRYGMEGNILEDFGPYYSDKYDFGNEKVFNFDGPGSDEVRRFILESMLYWLNDFHFDALRLNGVEKIMDRSPGHILSQLTGAIKAYAGARNRKKYIFAESDLNDVRLTASDEAFGLGFDAQLNLDFHRSLFSFSTGRDKGVYEDFGKGAQVAEALRGFTYRGQYSKVREKSHGSDSASVSPAKFIASSETALDIGRRPRGERLNQLLAPGQHKMVAGLLLLSPQLPLVFQGNEYGEKRPFFYFSDFSDEEIIRSEREAAMARASRFGLTGQLQNPQSQETFSKCLLDSTAWEKFGHVQVNRLYTKLIELRKELGISGCESSDVETRFFDKLNGLFLFYRHFEKKLLVIFNIGGSEIVMAEELPEGVYECIFDSESDEYGGLGEIFPEKFGLTPESRVMSLPPWSFAVYRET